KENDAEHAWHAALMAILLSGYSNKKIDLLKTVTMILIHDIVEIDAGDTYAYDDEAKKTQRQREEKAADRIFGILPTDKAKELRDLWEEFERNDTPEANFAHVMDNLQPMMLNDYVGGKAWEEHGVVLSKVLERNKATPQGSEILWNYAFENIIKPNVNKKTIKNDI
ncbi:MAG: HD domain-containing protein, partial [Clostridia bacterium]|nr:HD domain-containing protein [Clostridia bacterium]